MGAIEARGLTKRFGDFTAVDSLDLDVDGEIFGFLGPNGAGKTTTISMLTTLLKPTSGTAKVNGFDIAKQRGDVRKSIGMVFQEPSVDDLLSGRENLEMHGRLYSMPSQLRKRRIAEALSLVELTDRADDLVKAYSGGMRRRLELARGLMHRPAVLFLDEPTLGLDPQTREHIWEYIRRLAKKERMTIMMTTHYMEEADRLCDRIAIIDRGKIVAMDTPKRLKRALGGDVVVIKQKGFKAGRVSRLPFVKKIERKDGEILLGVEEAHRNLQKLLRALGKIESVEVREASLNDVFLKYTGRKYREEGGEGGWSERVASFTAKRD
jgi:ABC-2 type transport system ATP-binding protein